MDLAAYIKDMIEDYKDYLAEYERLNAISMRTKERNKQLAAVDRMHRTKQNYLKRLHFTLETIGQRRIAEKAYLEFRKEVDKLDT